MPVHAGCNYYNTTNLEEKSIDVIRYGQLWIKIMWYVKQRQLHVHNVLNVKRVSFKLPASF